MFGLKVFFVKKNCVFFFSIQKEHASFTIEDGKYMVEKCGDAKVMVNGMPITDKTEMHHTDRYARFECAGPCRVCTNMSNVFILYTWIIYRNI